MNITSEYTMSDTHCSKNKNEKRKAKSQAIAKKHWCHRWVMSWIVLLFAKWSGVLLVMSFELMQFKKKTHKQTNKQTHTQRKQCCALLQLDSPVNVSSHQNYRMSSFDQFTRNDNGGSNSSAWKTADIVLWRGTYHACSPVEGRVWGPEWWGGGGWG